MGSTSVVIVNFNTRDHLRACLESVFRAGAHDVIVVDNCSVDGSAGMVRGEFPSVTLLVPERNVGYGAGANVGISHGSSDYVLLLNSDTMVLPGVVDDLAGFFDRNPRVSVVGPRLVDSNGTPQASCYPFPTPFHIFVQQSGLLRVARLIPGLRDIHLQTWSHDAVRSVPWVLGAALAIRRSAFESVGGFDESYFMYTEEVDLCHRLRAEGWDTYFAPVTTIVHVGGASTSQQRVAMHAEWFSSLQHFYRQHYSRRQLAELRVIMGAVVLGRLVRDAVRLRLSSNTVERQRLTENVAGWRRMLLGQPQ